MLLLLLSSSTAPPQQASRLTSPAEKSAFMFFSKSQVVLPRATLTEPGAKAERAGGRFCNTRAALFKHPCSLFLPTHTLFSHTHTLYPFLIVSTPWLSLRLIKGHGFIEGGRVEASAELFIHPFHCTLSLSLSHAHTHTQLRCRKLEQTGDRDAAYIGHFLLHPHHLEKWN